MSELLIATNAVTPAAPSVGFVSLYTKPDGLWYFQNSAGQESLLTTGGVLSVDGGSASALYTAAQILDGGGA